MNLYRKSHTGRYVVASSDDVAAHCVRETAARVPGVTIGAPVDSALLLLNAFRMHTSEVFGALFLDNRHRVISFEILFRGTIDHTTVYPREVVKRALVLNAAAVILAHNHPSGVPEPSDADRLITRRIRDALELIDVRLLDHIVVGNVDTVSLASRGTI